MPVLSIFYGIVITIYWYDHPLPHVHARYGEHEAQIDIVTGLVLAGSLPRRARSMVRRWTLAHQSELQAAWADASVGVTPARIGPLR